MVVCNGDMREASLIQLPYKICAASELKPRFAYFREGVSQRSIESNGGKVLAAGEELERSCSSEPRREGSWIALSARIK